MTKVILKKTVSHRVLNGHPWIFANEVSTIEGDANPGDIAEVFTMIRNF